MSINVCQTISFVRKRGVLFLSVNNEHVNYLFVYIDNRQMKNLNFINIELKCFSHTMVSRVN